MTEESGIDEVVASLTKTFEWECPQLQKARQDAELGLLQESIEQKLGGGRWRELSKIAEIEDEKKHPGRRRAFILLFAHLLRLHVQNAALRNGRPLSFMRGLNAYIDLTVL